MAPSIAIASLSAVKRLRFPGVRGPVAGSRLRLQVVMEPPGIPQADRRAASGHEKFT
jgi:hypothetical protein